MFSTIDPTLMNIENQASNCEVEDALLHHKIVRIEFSQGWEDCSTGSSPQIVIGGFS